MGLRLELGAPSKCGDRAAKCVHCADKLTYRTVGWPTDRVVVSQISIGRWDRGALATGQEALPIRVLGSARSGDLGPRNVRLP